MSTGSACKRSRPRSMGYIERHRIDRDGQTGAEPDVIVP